MSVSGSEYIKLRAVWVEVHDKAFMQSSVGHRVYKRLELTNETGVRVSSRAPEGTWELLIEVSENDKAQVVFPKWKGMSFDYVELDVPNQGSKHIILSLEDDTNQDVFISVCSDLVRELDTNGSSTKRSYKIISFIDRWTRFFEMYGTSMLSLKQQAGLYAELYFFRTLVDGGLEQAHAVSCWTGSEGGCHDFSLGDIAIEVKATMQKEPKKIYINSELQLNDSGFLSLYLYVLSLRSHDTTGETLTSLIESILKKLDPLELHPFKAKLISAGYLEAHAMRYTKGFSVLEEDAYLVKDDFPRILSLPPGIGDVRYSLLLAFCDNNSIPIDELLNQATRIQ